MSLPAREAFSGTDRWPRFELSFVEPMKKQRCVPWRRALLLSAIALNSGCNTKGDLSAYLRKEVTAEPASRTKAAVVPLANTQPPPSASAPSPVPAPPAVVAPIEQAPGAAHDSRRAHSPDLSTPVPLRIQSPVSPLGASALPTSPSFGSTLPMAPIESAQVASRAPNAATGRRKVSMGGGAVSGGSVSNAARMIAGLRSQLTDCYARETSVGTGSIRFTLAVGPSGAVTNVTTAPAGGLSSQLVACATSRVKTAKFEVSEGGGATVQFPATFTIEGTPFDARPAKNNAKARASGL
jgi:hypothetical protein